MSIVKLVKLTVYGHSEAKNQILADLQDLGCLHLIPLKAEDTAFHKGGPSSESREALKFLLQCPNKRAQVKESLTFDSSEVERETLEIKQKIDELENEKDYLNSRIKDLMPWGDFKFPPLEELNNLRLWFYAVPHREMGKVSETDLIWEVVAKDARTSFVAVIAEDEPQNMPVSRTHTGSRSLSELAERLKVVERELEDLQVRRCNLTRWCYLFTKNLYKLEDRADRSQAAMQTHDEDPVFAIQAWAPAKDLAKLRDYAKKNTLILETEKPSKGDNPPTLLSNKPTVAGGQDLVSFYTTPGYWLWDPSIIVFFSFAVFFAMIVSDAAYGVVLGIILTLLWKKMGKSDFGKRLRTLGAMLVISTISYGIIVGSYFGVSPAEGTFLAKLKIIDMKNFDVMMKISILIGVAHLILANAADAWRWKGSVAAFSPLGWIFMFLGATLIFFGIGEKTHNEFLTNVGIGTMCSGGLLVLFFTSVRGPLWKRLLKGLQGLARLSGAFGDTLSYLRLFALGLASASLAMTFNNLAKQVGEAVPGLGILFSLLIIFLGHGLNLLLSFASGVIHGLRLNFIEFFNWGIPEEGYPFRAFARKEKMSWIK